MTRVEFEREATVKIENSEHDLNEKAGGFENNRITFIVHLVAHFILLSCTYMVRSKQNQVSVVKNCTSARRIGSGS